MGFSFGIVNTISTGTATGCLAAVILFIIFFEYIVELIEILKEASPADYLMAQKVMKELMIMGLISFVIIMFQTTSYAATAYNIVIAIDYFHIVLFYTAGIFVLAAFCLVRMSRAIAIQYERYFFSSSDASPPSFSEYTCIAYFVKLFANIEVHRRTEFKMLSTYFVEAYKLPKNFVFCDYLAGSFEKYTLSLLDIGPFSWFIILVIALLNYVRVEAMKAMNLPCTEKRGSSGHRYLAGQAPQIDSRCASFDVHVFLFGGFMLTLSVVILLCMCRLYELRLLALTKKFMEQLSPEQHQDKRRGADIHPESTAGEGGTGMNNFDNIEAGSSNASPSPSPNPRQPKHPFLRRRSVEEKEREVSVRDRLKILIKNLHHEEEEEERRHRRKVIVWCLKTNYVLQSAFTSCYLAVFAHADDKKSSRGSVIKRIKSSKVELSKSETHDAHENKGGEGGHHGGSHGGVEVKGIFLFQSPWLFLRCVEVVVLLFMLYIAMLMTSFFSVSRKSDEGSADGNTFLLFLPILVCTPCLGGVVEIANKIWAVSSVRYAVMGQVFMEEEVNEEILTNFAHEVVRLAGDDADDEAVEQTLRDLFEEMDADHSHELQEFELKSLLMALGLHYSDEKIHRLFRSMDSDKGGTVNFDEFSNVVMAVKRSESDRQSFMVNSRANSSMSVVSTAADLEQTNKFLRTVAGARSRPTRNQSWVATPSLKPSF